MSFPAPGTIWKHKKTQRSMRAVIANVDEVIAHNAELAMVHPEIPMTSWRGTPEEFARAFVPASALSYPATAR